VDIEKSYDFYRQGRYFDDTGKLSRRKLGNLLDVLQKLGDIGDARSIERFLLAGVTQVGD
jgi:hypothetical protein